MPKLTSIQSAWHAATNQIPVRDCQTQTISQADLELALMQAAENARNHQIDPETSLSSDGIQREYDTPEEDEALLNGTDKSQKRHEKHKPQTGVDHASKDKSAIPPLKGGSGGDPGGDPGGAPGRNAPDDQNATIKKVAKYAIGFTAAATAIGVGAFVAAPLVLTGMGFTTVGISSGSIGASMMSASAIANGGGVAAGSLVALMQSAGAAGGLTAATCAGVGISGAAIGTAIAAAGEVSVGAVRYIKRKNNKNQTKGNGTQTDPDVQTDDKE